jgi:hypothetical protein
MLKIREIPGSKVAGWAGADAITLYPFIFYGPVNPPLQMRVHEHIHCTQVIAKGWLYFYISYLVYYYINLYWHKMPQDQAYREIPYEAEAYAHQDDWTDKIAGQFPEIKTPLA